MVLSLTLFHTQPANNIIKTTFSTCYGDNLCKACSNYSEVNVVVQVLIVVYVQSFAGSRTSKTKTANDTGRCKALIKIRSSQPLLLATHNWQI